MNRLQEILERAKNDLDEIGVPWCLVGGLAVSVWCEPRLTRDVDIAVAASTDREAETTIRELGERGYRLESLVEQEATARMATARLGLEDESNGIVVDLLFASSGIEQEATREAVRLEVFEGTVVPVATRPYLIVMKLLARDDRNRPLDADDLKRLIAVASEDELDHARRLADLISERGFDRGRSLISDLEAELT